MDDVITDYATARSEVKQSFLGRMVGPAFVAGALAAASTLIPFPVGAYDSIPNVWDSPMMSTTMTGDFPHAANYFASFVRNATICSVLAASPAIYQYYEQQTAIEGENEVEQTLVQEAS